MDKIRSFMAEHRAAALAAVFLLIVFVGGSAMSAVNVANHRAQEAASQEGEQGQPAGGQEGQEQQDGLVSLTDSQSAAIENYDDATRDFISTLSSSVWSANSGRYTLRFENDQYTETVDGETTQHSYAILRLDGGMDDAGNDVATVAVETDTGTHVLTYSNSTGTSADGATQVTSTLSSSSMFALKDVPYERADAVENITVKGLNSEVTNLVGGSPDELTVELSRWCAVHYPTATEATWNQVVSIDWENGVISTGFTLNGESAVNLTVVYLMDSGAFEFSY